MKYKISFPYHARIEIEVEGEGENQAYEKAYDEMMSGKGKVIIDRSNPNKLAQPRIIKVE